MVEIDPKTAQQWLKLNARNRPISQVRVNLYAQFIRQGQWQLNGESIKLTDEELIDGQHRLLAVVAADLPIKSVVVYGLDPSSFMTIDQGKRRSTADALSVIGHKQYNRELGALAYLIWVTRKQSGDPRHTGSMAAPQQELLRIIEDTPDLETSVESTGTLRKRIGANHTAMAYLYWLFGSLDKSGRDSFFWVLRDGISTGVDDPVHRYREQLISNGQRHSKRMTAAEQIALGIKSWNAFKAGRRVKALGWRPAVEAFPVAAL